jgi:hypothetical protein
MTIVNPTGGIVTYKFVATELFAPKMDLEVEITDVASQILTVLDIIRVKVRSQIG